MLYIIGLGLRGLSSLTMEGAAAIEASSRIFFETYTSVSPSGTILDLEEKFGKKVEPLSREELEEENTLIGLASSEKVAIIVTGDPLSATTHNQIRMDAAEKGVEVIVVENASILSVVPGRLGLFPYRMGPPVSLPFPEGNFLPKSVLEKIHANQSLDLHTLLLLDLRDGRTMYPYEALETLLKMEDKYSLGVISGDSMIFAVSRVAQDGEKLIHDTVQNILELRLQESPSALVIPAKLNHNEVEFVKVFSKACSYFR